MTDPSEARSSPARSINLTPFTYITRSTYIAVHAALLPHTTRTQGKILSAEQVFRSLDMVSVYRHKAKLTLYIAPIAYVLGQFHGSARSDEQRTYQKQELTSAAIFSFLGWALVSDQVRRAGPMRLPGIGAVYTSAVAGGLAYWGYHHLFRRETRFWSRNYMEK